MENKYGASLDNVVAAIERQNNILREIRSLLSKILPKDPEINDSIPYDYPSGSNGEEG